MKKSGKILIGLLVLLSLVIGYFIGIVVDFPPVQKSKVSGTIGKINNYRNVKVSENDVQLRDELLKNEKLTSEFKKYFSYQYLASIRMSEDMGSAVKIAGAIPEFADTFKAQVDALDRFQVYITEARKDILLALSALQNVAKTDKQNISLLISNANNAISQINFRGQTVISFLDATDSFFKTHEVANYPDLKKAHDQLLLHQIKSAVVSRDKLKIKYLDKKEFLGSKDDVLQCCLDQGNLPDIVAGDLATIGDVVPDQQTIGTTVDFGVAAILDTPGTIGLVVTDASETMGSSGDQETIGSDVIFDSSTLSSDVNESVIGDLIPDSDTMGSVIDSENLGVFTDVTGL